MEIGGINHDINMNRVRGIVETIPKYYPEMRVQFPSKVWHGLRPCSPDGLPFYRETAVDRKPGCCDWPFDDGYEFGTGNRRVRTLLIEGTHPVVRPE